MNDSQHLTKCLLACTLAVAMVSTLTAQTAVDVSAKVVRIKGPARYTSGNGVWQPLKVGAVLRSGTIVQTSTERDSFVDIVLGDAGAAMPTPVAFKPSIPNSRSSSGVSYQPASEQNVIRIWENTALGIDKLASMQTGAEVVTDTQLDLKAGRITGSVNKMSPASKYEIKLPNGVAGIRGTVYDVSAEGLVRVLIGQVVLAWVDAKTGAVATQVIMGGNQYDAKSAQMTPLPASENEVFSKVLSAMKVTPARGQVDTVYAGDKTIHHVSPVGPPFNPPGPPPVIPPGRGRGGGPP